MTAVDLDPVAPAPVSDDPQRVEVSLADQIEALAAQIGRDARPDDATRALDRCAPGDMVAGTPETFVQSMPAPDPDSTSPTPFPSGVLSDEARLLLIDAMPVAVILIDEVANIRYVNMRTADMIGVDRCEILGRNVLDFVDDEDVDYAADLFNRGDRYQHEVMGPSRIRYVDASGRSQWTQIWAQSAPPELGVTGFIVTLTRESVTDVLASAVASVAVDDALDRTLDAVALAARGLPFAGVGAVLSVTSSDAAAHHEFTMNGQWPIGPESINASGTPWRSVAQTSTAIDIADVEQSNLSDGAKRLLLDADVHAVFVRPILDDAGERAVGVYVLFRPEAATLSPNQEHHLGDIIKLAGLAFSQKRRRLELEAAAHSDALTGLANRASFNDRLRTERRATDVLFVDLDHFKAVNDTYGHDVGDGVIAAAGQRLAGALRRGDAAYRTGGDEFVVLCESSGVDPSERIALAERIIESLSAPFDIGIHRVRIGATIGIAAAGPSSLTDAVRSADRALYRAKELGRSGWAHD